MLSLANSNHLQENNGEKEPEKGSWHPDKHGVLEAFADIRDRAPVPVQIAIFLQES